jgi:hypothetical protein
MNILFFITVFFYLISDFKKKILIQLISIKKKLLNKFPSFINKIYG